MRPPSPPVAAPPLVGELLLRHSDHHGQPRGGRPTPGLVPGPGLLSCQQSAQGAEGAADRAAPVLQGTEPRKEAAPVCKAIVSHLLPGTPLSRRKTEPRDERERRKPNLIHCLSCFFNQVLCLFFLF